MCFQIPSAGLNCVYPKRLIVFFMTTFPILPVSGEGKGHSPRLQKAFFGAKVSFMMSAFCLLLAANAPLCLAQTSSNGTDSLPPAPSAPSTGDAAGTVVADAGASSSSAAVQARRASRRPVVGDYVAALGGLALVLSARRHPSPNATKAFEGDQQFSVISPFPGGGYSVLPNGDFQPGGAMQVNIPLAYVPTRFAGAVSVDVAQSRGGQTFATENGRNGTANAGIGFPIAGRGVWVSAMFLSQYSVTHLGNDLAYCASVQLAPETRSAPAIAIGVQDLTNARIRSPFLVATKRLGTSPAFATVGVGRGRFSGSSVFGGVSYSPARRVSLSAEYDGLQFNLGAGLALTRRFSLLGSYNDLAATSNRPAGRLGRRFQLGANYTF